MIIQSITGATSQKTSQPTTKVSSKVIQPLSGSQNSQVSQYAPGAFVQPITPTPVASSKTIFQKIQDAAANIGKTLQKTPNLDLGSKGQKTFKATDSETKIVNFMSNFPSMVLQSWGQSLEMVSTEDGRTKIKQGAKDLPNTFKQAKTHIDNKQWMEAANVVLSNPAVSVALDVSDFIPTALVAKLGIKSGTKNLLKKTVKEGVEEAEQKVVKEVVETAPKTATPTVKVEEPIQVAQVKPLSIPEETILKNQAEGIELVKDAIQSGDEAAAKALYDELPKESYTPSFENLKQSVTRINERESAQLANESIEMIKEKYGADAPLVGKMKNFLRLSADKKSPEGTMFSEHIPARIFGTGSDEVASNLGMSEKDFMAQMLDELGDTKQIVPKAPKEVEVPRSQLPIGQGKEKVSRLEARVKNSLEDATPETIEKMGLSTYRQMNNKDTIKAASEFVANDPDKALKVLKGEIDAPAGLNTNSIYVAMANNPSNSFELTTKLATLKSTAMGQNIEILKELNPNSPAKIMNDIYVIREKAFEKKYGGRTVKEVTDGYIKKGQAKMAPPKLADWGDVIKSVRC